MQVQSYLSEFPAHRQHLPDGFGGVTNLYEDLADSAVLGMVLNQLATEMLLSPDASLVVSEAHSGLPPAFWKASICERAKHVLTAHALAQGCAACEVSLLLPVTPSDITAAHPRRMLAFVASILELFVRALGEGKCVGMESASAAEQQHDGQLVTKQRLAVKKLASRLARKQVPSPYSRRAFCGAYLERWRSCKFTVRSEAAECM